MAHNLFSRLVTMNRESPPPDEMGAGDRVARLPTKLPRLADTLVGVTQGPASRPEDVVTDSARAFASRFVPDETIAIGGMGVLRRYKDSALSRDVVVKSIRKDQSSDQIIRQRFLREARIQAYLQHPCIVPVYDLGNAARGDVYFTMAHIGGRTLGDVILRLAIGEPATVRRFSLRTLLDAFCRVCLAVAYAHEKGVIHRDLKPENVMLGDFGEVYVIDWGIAKLDERADRRSSGEAKRPSDETVILPRVVYEEDEEDPPELTEAGSTIGTLEYMAPEQYLASARPDPRCDIYSLGAILYEVLSHKPFREAPSRAEMVKLVWRDTLYPSARSVENIPEELDAIWRKATDLSPEKRFQSAREMHDAIVGYLDSERENQRRREVAMELVRQASSELEEAPESGPEAEERRGRALSRIGQALAADPSQADAMSALVNGLLSQPSEKVPEVEQEIAATERKVGARSAGLSAGFYAAWFVFLVMGHAWMGVLSHRVMGIFGGVVLALVAYNYWVWHTGRFEKGHMLAIMGLGFLAVALAGSFLGPLVLVPSLATTMFGAFTIAMRSDRRVRTLAMALSACAVLLPSGLQLAGVLPASYVYEDGKITILPLLVALPSHVTPAILTAIALLVVVLTNLLTAQAVRELAEAERSARTQAFRLRQLLPARVSLPPDGASP